MGGGPAPVHDAPTLHRSLTRLDLVVIGVAQIIGAGIFVISGVGVKIAGPGIILSFLLAGGWLRLFLWLALGLAVYFLYAWHAGRFRLGAEE